MCEQCNGTNGKVVQHDFYTSFEPCPNEECGAERRIILMKQVEDLLNDVSPFIKEESIL